MGHPRQDQATHEHGEHDDETAHLGLQSEPVVTPYAPRTATVRPMAVGIMSFGSLIDDPGEEIGPRVIDRWSVERTPFNVEFARSSRTRGGAPTLVPVPAGGAPLPATILVLDADEHDARSLLHRREGHRTGGPAAPGDGSATWIRRIDWPGLAACIYTGLEPNIEPLTAERLAELALWSVATTAGERRADGISYLAAAKARGVVTPLSGPYEAEILRRTGTHTLREAFDRTRGS